MKERPPKGSEPTRRGFLQGMGAMFSRADRAVTVGSGASFGTAIALTQEKVERKRELALLATRDEGFKRSTTFKKHVEENEQVFTNTHMSGVRQYGKKEALNAEGRTRIGEVKKNFMNASVTGLPEPLREELAFLGPGLPAKESSYNNASDSGVAVRIFQFQPEVYKALGFTDKDDKDNKDATDMKFLENQIACANLFFAKEYKNLTETAEPALKLIQEQYFPEQEERFMRQFMPLVMLSVYHAGPGRVKKALVWFANEAKMNAEGYDVYEAMSSSLKEENEGTPGTKNDAVPGYGEHSSNYAQKVFAFARLIEKDIGEGKIQLAVR